MKNTLEKYVAKWERFSDHNKGDHGPFADLLLPTDAQDKTFTIPARVRAALVNNTSLNSIDESVELRVTVHEFNLAEIKFNQLMTDARDRAESSTDQTQLDHAERHMHDNVQAKVRNNLLCLCDHPEFATETISHIKTYTSHLTNGYIPKMREWISAH